jgi:hypothetical protein
VGDLHPQGPITPGTPLFLVGKNGGKIIGTLLTFFDMQNQGKMKDFAGCKIGEPSL